MTKKKNFIYFYLGLIFIIFIGFRTFNLFQTINFGPDQGRDYLKVYEIYHNKELTLIGPPSEYKVSGKEFYFGPASYYTLLPILLISNWNILQSSWIMIALNAFVVLFVIWVLNKYLKDKKIVYIFGTFCAVSPAFVIASKSYWNPFLMLPISFLLIAILSYISSSKKILSLIWLILGFLFGLGFEYHYSFILAIFICIGFLVWKRKLNIKSLLYICFGFFVGVAPMILFELRNGFYNTATLIAFLTSGSNAKSQAGIKLFYLISILPFVLLVFSFFISRIKNKLIIWIILITYCLLSILYLATRPADILNLQTLQLISSEIAKDNPANFNILNQTTNDNRAMALRYLLTAKGIKPMSENDYPTSQTLFVFSRQDINKLLKNPVWELSTFGNAKIQRKNLEDITLYKLEK